MRLAGISSINDANNYLKNGNFIVKHNTKYSAPALQQGNAHGSPQLYDLDSIFSITEKRLLANDYTISYNKQIFQLHQEQKTIIRPKNEITVKTAFDGTIRLWIRSTELNFTILQQRPNLQSQENSRYPTSLIQNLTLTVDDGFRDSSQFTIPRRVGMKPASAAVELIKMLFAIGTFHVADNRNFSLCFDIIFFSLLFS